MELKEKVDFWLKNLKLFSLNSEIQCSREEKILKQELIGTRHVNLAFKEMIKHMHCDMEIENYSVINSPVVKENGVQILLFAVGDVNYYTDITLIHEILKYPTKNYNQFAITNPPMVGILNWYEGLVPVIQTSMMIKNDIAVENFMLVYDIGKEIFAFTVSDVYEKHEIESSFYSNDLTIGDRVFKHLDFESYEMSLIQTRMKMKI